MLARIVMYLCLASNALAVAFGTVLAYILSDKDGKAPFVLTGEVGDGIPKIELPPFSTTYNNETYEFIDMVEKYGSSLAFIPLVAILESVAIAKAFCKSHNSSCTFTKTIAIYCFNSKRKDCRRHTRNVIPWIEQHIRILCQVHASYGFFYKDCC